VCGTPCHFSKNTRILTAIFIGQRQLDNTSSVRQYFQTRPPMKIEKIPEARSESNKKKFGMQFRPLFKEKKLPVYKN
jgi:hypothetical protein